MRKRNRQRFRGELRSAVVLGAEDLAREVAEIGRGSLDLHGGGQRQGSRAQGAVYLGVSVEGGGQGAPAHFGRKPS